MMIALSVLGPISGINLVHDFAFDDRVFLFLEFFEEFGVEFVLGVVFEFEGVVDDVDQVVGEALAHGVEVT